jgi:uracil phosphoribosyltransferase
VICPDPMGATGSTIEYTYHYYQNLSHHRPLEIIALHLIVTPEYLLRMKKNCPGIKVVFLRLDRGLSTEKALKEIPGKIWEEERGLSEFDYIVPGAGGIGEVLNNSFC